MDDDMTFEQGYVEGWREVMGPNAGEPSIPGYAYAGGRSNYEEGFERGKADARRLLEEKEK